MTLDFTLKKYEELCKLSLEAGIQTSSVQDYLVSESHDRVILIMRHDIDRYLKVALRMAEIGSREGMKLYYEFQF